MVTFVQVMGTHTGDSSPGILLFFDNKRYLFNCGEGTQRFCTEHKIKFPKLDNMFFTRNQWQCTGGLPGLMMTIADTGAGHLNLFGPPNFYQFLYATRFFLYRKSMDVRVTEFAKSGEAESHWSTIKAPMMAVGAQDDTKLEVDPLECEAKGFFQDDMVSIWPIVLDPKHKGGSVIGEEKSREKRSWDDMENINDESTIKAPETLENLEEGGLSPAVRKSMLNHLSVPSSAPINTPQSSSSEMESECSRYEQMVRETEGVQQRGGKNSHFRDQSVPKVKKNDMSICYVCETAPVPGRFDIAKAKELKVPKGPMFTKLIKEGQITLPDGRVIKASDVMGPTTPGPAVLIIDCPTLDHMKSLVNQKALEPYYDGSANAKCVLQCIIHMVPMTVLSSPLYCDWSSKFGPTPQHIIVNSDVCDNQIVFQSSYEMQCRLSTLDPSVFPIPASDSPDKEKICAERLVDLVKQGFPNKTVCGKPLLKYNLIPIKRAGLHTGDLLKIVPPQSLVDETLALEEGKDVLFLGKALASDWQTQSRHVFRHTDKNVQVQLLGTGSAMPSKYRNVSASLIDIKKKGIILLDAGEATYGQMCRRYGYDHIETILSQIKAVYISHMHADHHLGLVNVLLKRQLSLVHLNLPFERPLVIGPKSLGMWLNEYSQLESLQYSFIDAATMNVENETYDKEMEDRLHSDLGITFRTVPVIHCPNATGCVVTECTIEDRERNVVEGEMMQLDRIGEGEGEGEREGEGKREREGETDRWRVVYSGDTRPCQDLVDAGHGATLLLHEATFEDEMLRDAIDKRHSTTLEAVKIGANMDAGLTLLTHFSQRYAKIPKIQPVFSYRSAVAFDLMSIDFKNMPKMPLFTEALKVVFKEEHEELNMKH